MDLKFVCIFALFIAVCYGGGDNDTPGFFLKVTKNVPRLGRAAEPENTFNIKNKQMPRIGRRSYNGYYSNNDENAVTWLSRYLSPTKRVLGNPNIDHLNGYHTVQPFDTEFLMDLIENDIGEESSFKFISWKAFDETLAADPVLYNKLISVASQTDNDIRALVKSKYNYERFIPLSGDPMYIRTDRSAKHFQ